MYCTFNIIQPIQNLLAFCHGRFYSVHVAQKQLELSGFHRGQNKGFLGCRSINLLGQAVQKVPGFITILIQYSGRES